MALRVRWSWVAGIPPPAGRLPVSGAALRLPRVKQASVELVVLAEHQGLPVLDRMPLQYLSKMASRKANFEIARKSINETFIFNPETSFVEFDIHKSHCSIFI